MPNQDPNSGWTPIQPTSSNSEQPSAIAATAATSNDGWTPVNQPTTGDAAEKATIEQKQAQRGGAGGSWTDGLVPEPSSPVAKHGLLRRAWDYVNTPVADFVLPEGVKTADLVKAAAFEHLYKEAYIPGVNDFDTKAQTHFGNVKGKGAESPNKAYVRAFLNGVAGDTAQTVAGFTSPLSLATMGAGKAEAIPGAIGKIAKPASALAGTAFAGQGIYQTEEALRDAIKHGASAENLSEMAGGAGQALLGGAGVAKAVGGVRNDIAAGIKNRVTPELQPTESGAQIPVRNTSKLGNAAAQAVSAEIPANTVAQQTAPAVAKGIGTVAARASEAGGKYGAYNGIFHTPEEATVPAATDRFGIKGHAANLYEGQAKPVYQALDEASNGEFTKAQDDMDKYRYHDPDKFEEAQNRKQAIIDENRERLKAQGLDPDEADAAYRKKIALEKVANKLDQATGPSTGRGEDYSISGKKLAKAFDDLVKKNGENGILTRAGFTNEHIAQVQELADILKNQEQVPRVSTFMKGVARSALALGGLSRGGLVGAAEALTGESLAEKVGQKLADRMFGAAMNSPAVARDITDGVKSGDSKTFVDKVKDQPWFQNISDVAKRLWNEEKGEAGAPGTVGKSEPSQDLRDFSKEYTGKDIGIDLPKSSPEYKNTGGGMHEVQTNPEGPSSEGSFHSPQGNREGYLIAQDTQVPGETQVKSHMVAPELRGKGVGTSQLESMAKGLSEDPSKRTLLSDDDMTVSAVGSWRKLQAKYPEAVSEYEGANGDPRFRFDLSKLRPEDAAQNEIGTMRPRGPKVIDEHNPSKIVGMKAVEDRMDANPQFATRLAATLSKYRGLALDAADYSDPKTVVHKFVNQATDNLKWLYNQVPDVIKGSARKWYKSANTSIVKPWAEQYGKSPRQIAGAIAALSPQNPWENNVGVAKSILDTLKDKQNHEWTDNMESQGLDISRGAPSLRKIFKAIRGKTLGELKEPVEKAMWIRLYGETEGVEKNNVYSPEGQIVGVGDAGRAWTSIDNIAKAVRILDDDSMQNIHENLGYGHKVRNFYNNLINPDSKNGHVTVDTHAVAAAHSQPLSGIDAEVGHNFGTSPKGIPGAPKSAPAGMSSGVYPLYAEAYRRAAASLGIPVHELQSSVWEGARSLFGDKKGPEVGLVKGIWKDYKDGKISLDEARQKTIDYSGGFKKPNWMPQSEWDKSQGTDFDFGGENER